MEAVWTTCILFDVPIIFDITTWYEYVKYSQLEATVEKNLIAYIEQRNLGLGFDDVPQYKFIY